MGLVILAVIGGIVGWLAAIIMRTEDMPRVRQNIMVSMIAAIFAGSVVNAGSVIVGINAGAVLVAFMAAVISVMILHAVREQTTA